MMSLTIESKKINNPFPGLRPFETDEYRLFFGREGQASALISRLERSHFLAIVGTSGSGKSSLVRAGLLPALRGGLMAGAGSGWRIAIMRPGSDPVGNLAAALADKGVLSEAAGGLAPAEALAVIEATLRRGSLGLVDAARQARLAEHDKLLVVVDQFEELFRFRAARPASSSGDDASAFVKLLLEASQQRELQIYIVPTMRSDFLGDCAQFQGLPEAINDGQYLIPRMTRDERRFAITGPVGVTRGKISEPLVNRLMNDVGDNPDQLPILQHALMRTWDYWAAHRRNGEPIGIEHYEAVGTMSDALSHHADEAFNELPHDRSRQTAEKLFKALTERGADNREIRRPTCLRDICAIAEATAAEVIAVVDVFRGGGRSFLMPPAGVVLGPDTVIDISHESLIRNWLRLKDWVNEEAQSARIYRRLAEAAVLHREGSEGLLQDPALQIALDWREKTNPTAAWAGRYHSEFEIAIAYLDESRSAREAQVVAEERRRNEALERDRRDLMQAKAFAAQQAQSARRMRSLIVALCVILLLTLGTAAYAFNLRSQALESRKAAVLEREQALKSAEEAREARKVAVAQTDAAKASEQIALAAQKRMAVEEKHAEDEAKRANDEAKRANEQTAIAVQNLEFARRAAIEAKEARTVAEENARQVTGALERGELIRAGLEASRREDFPNAKESFINLHVKLQALQPDAPRVPGYGNFTRPQYRRFADDYGWTLSHLGEIYHKLGDLDTAIESYEKARVILEDVLKTERARPILVETYHGLAHAYHDNAVKRSAPSRMIRDDAWERLTQQQFRKAEEFYMKAVEYQKPLAAENPLAAVAAYKNLAKLYVDIGKFNDAETNLKKVIEAYRTVEQRPGDGTIGARKELAEFYRGQNRYQDAAQTYNELIDLQEGLGSQGGMGLRELADSYSELGQIYSALQDDERADNTFELVDKIQQMVLKVKHKGAGVDAANTNYDQDLDQVGDIYLKLGRLAEAKRSYEAALSIRNGVEAKKKSLGTSYAKLANLYGEHYHDYDKSEEYYKLLIESQKDSAVAGSSYYNLKQYIHGLRELGRIYSSERNKPVEAEELFSRALTLLVSVRQKATWRAEEATYSSLLDLYRGREDKKGDLEQTYVRKLEAMIKLDRILEDTANSDEDDWAGFVAAYYKTIGEVVVFYLEQKNTARAEAIYRQAFAETQTSFIESVIEPKQLVDMISALEKCQALLRGMEIQVDTAKLDDLIKQARARQRRDEEKQEKHPLKP